MIQPFMSETLNSGAPESQRATVLSVASFLHILPYIALAPLIGFLNSRGQLEYFLVGWAGLICVATLIYLKLKKRDNTIALTDTTAGKLA